MNRVEITEVELRTVMCTYTLNYPEADKPLPCGRPAEYRVKHSDIVASSVCGTHLSGEVAAFFRIAEEYRKGKAVQA